MNDKVRAAAWVAGAVVVLAGVAACGPGAADHVKAVSYGTGAEGKADADVRLPSWVPGDATGVTEVIRTTGAERLLRYTPGRAGLPPACGPGPASTTPATLSADWWPRGQERRTDRVCDRTWHVVVDEGAIYAYRPETLPRR